MWTGVWLMFALAAACGVYLAVIAGPIIIVIGVVSVVAALGYVGPGAVGAEPLLNGPAVCPHANARR